MQRNLDLHYTQETSSLSQTQDTKSIPDELSREWISAFNTSILTTGSPGAKDRTRELSELMQTPEFASLLFAAQHLAHHEGVSKEDATERLIRTFREIDYIWKQIVMARGLKALIE